MDHLSSYQQLEQKWRETLSRREQEDAEFTVARDKAMNSLSNIRKAKIQNYGELSETRLKETQQEESAKCEILKEKHAKELQDLRDKQAEELAEREEVKKERLRKVAEMTMIDNMHRGKETELEEQWAYKKTILQRQRNDEDVKAKEDVFNLLREQSQRAPSFTSPSIADSNEDAVQSKKHQRNPESSGSSHTLVRSPTSNPTHKRQKAVQPQRNVTLFSTRAKLSTPANASARSVSTPSLLVTPVSRQQTPTPTEGGSREPRPLQTEFQLRSIQAKPVGSTGPWTTWKPSRKPHHEATALQASIHQNNQICPT